MINKIVIILVYVFTAILYIVGPNSIFKVCEVGDSPMKCHWSVLAESGVAIILLGIALIYGITKTFREKSLISFVTILIGTVAIIIPSVLIGGCSMKTMACQSQAFPAFYVISLLIILVSIANIFYQLKKNKEIKNAE